MNLVVNETASGLYFDSGTQKSTDFRFWKNTILLLFFLVVTPLTLSISFLSLFILSPQQSKKDTDVIYPLNLIKLPKAGVRVYASLPVNTPTISAEAVVGDARPEIIRLYMESYSSPLSPFSKEIVQAADRYGLDFRLITAIAQQESNLCKKIPPLSYNCWGWGIHSEGTLGFSSFSQGVEEVSKGLREEYLNKGFTDVDKIMTKYTPLSNGSWSFGVNKFMSEME